MSAVEEYIEEAAGWDVVATRYADAAIAELEAKLAALKARHCEDCSAFMACSNEVQTASGEALTVDYCSRWTERNDP